MKNRIFLHRASVLRFFMCLCAAYTCMFFPTHAASALPESGRSGGCTWKYEQVGGDMVLTIAPTVGTDAALGAFSWRSSCHKKNTKRVVVKGTVKMGFSAASMFEDFEQTKSMDLSGLDVISVTSTEKMFYRCEALTSLKVSSWNVSKVMSMEHMFRGCKALTSLDVLSWNVTNVTSMGHMFDGCSALTSLDVSRWNVSKVTNMWYMFFRCSALTSLDVSTWNVFNVMSMGSMFDGCSALTSLNVSKWNVSNVIYMGGMFAGCKSLTALDVSRWNLSKTTHVWAMFFGCSALTSLDVSTWNVSNVINMRYMFSKCSALTSLDFSNWKTTDKILLKDKFGMTGMHGMFAKAQSLKHIFLGSGFHITDDAKFSDVGSQIGTQWMQINLGRGGTHENPKGKVFETSSDLVAFHHDRTKRETDTEEYVRVAPAKLRVTFNKGMDDGVGKMTSQVYDASTIKMLPKNAYTRAGYVFSCWKDSEGNVYTDGQSFENSYWGKVGQNGEALERTLELVAQWEKATIFIYKVKEGAHITLSCTQEEVASAADPLGSEIIIRVPQDKEVKWTVQEGGTDAASSWSHKGTTLGSDEIKAAALKNGKFISTTFIAELVDKTYTITFDAGVPSGISVKGLPSPIVIKHGQEAQIPAGVTLSRPDYQFAGMWNDDIDGKGASYRAGSKIRNVFPHTTLYAQWRAILTYAVKEGTYVSLSRAEEQIDSSCDPLGTEVIAEVPEDKEVIWTVQKGGGDTASEWFYKGDVLEKDEIKKVVRKGGKFVPTTFVAELVDKFYAIIFDANAPEGTKVQGQMPGPLIVKHGQRARIPSGITLSCPGYKFKGEWNDDKEGEGASYRAGSKIGGVFSHTMLYAQWERAATFATAAKESTQAALL